MASLQNERRSTVKVDFLKDVESQVQKFWDENHLIAEDAPTDQNDETKKFMVTFPFPYMNGKLHLGHTFSLSKCEFVIRYYRLKGYKCLFPFGFHCTGMPIKACADKLKREMEQFGCPPLFPVEETKLEHELDASKLDITKDKCKSQKSKVQAKSGSAKYQWQIMLSLGIEEKDIPNFQDANYWLTHFPPLAIADLKRMGIFTDWRRSFITTDVNPYFDSFVRWQFIRLKERNKVKYGKRYTIFSPRDNQPCMDHDRSSGEGVGPQEYTLIKMKISLETLKPNSAIKNLTKRYEGSDLYLLAGTLRPETMYGQTNCWLGPDITYVAFKSSMTSQIYICSPHAMKNLAFQGHCKNNSSCLDSVLFEINGRELMGIGLEAPLTPLSLIYTFPMMTIKADKGTAVVTSVPSDSPDDFAALSDLKRKEAMRSTFGIPDEVVLALQPIPIIHIGELGDLAAVSMCEKLKIQSQNDREKLAEAKDLVYMRGFYEGVMMVGEYKGQKVQDVKPLLRKHLIDNGLALAYMEPERQVLSRSGDTCVVSLCDQWYLDYGEEKWRSVSEGKCLKQMNCFHSEVRKNFEATFDWLREHACSRTYGLGSKLPWDESWLIESLSDSTIYNAFYTVAHVLADGRESLDGSVNKGVSADLFTPDVWDYVFFEKAPVPSNVNKIGKEILERMRREFQFWYPVDVRVSGKDLVPNHLTYYIYNHTAMWREEDGESGKWPRGIRANGHLLLNAEKMSKSTGNFLTLAQAIDKFSADGMRLSLADAGDSVEDANFDIGNAEAGILRLYAFYEWSKEMLSPPTGADEDKNPSLQIGGNGEEEFVMLNGEGGDVKNVMSGLSNFHDKVFYAEMCVLMSKAADSYERMMFRQALQSAFFEFQRSRDKYRDIVGGTNMNKHLIRLFIKWQCIALSPICPHITDYIYRNLLGHSLSILQTSWPDVKVDTNSESLIKASEFLVESVRNFRNKLKNAMNSKSQGSNNAKTKQQNGDVGEKSKSMTMKTVHRNNHATIYVAQSYPAWQVAVLNVLKSMYESEGHSVQNPPSNKIISQNEDLKKVMSVGDKKVGKKVMPFVQHIKDQICEKKCLEPLSLELQFDEFQVLSENRTYICNALSDVSEEFNSVEIEILSTTSDDLGCRPANPIIQFSAKEFIGIELINNQDRTPFFTMFQFPIFEGDTPVDLTRRMVRRDRKLCSKSLKLYRYTDCVMGPRSTPSVEKPLQHLTSLKEGDKFELVDCCSKVLLNGDVFGDTLVYTVL